MSSYYGPWTWSQPHGRHYAYLMSANGVVLDTLWEGPGDLSTSSLASPPSQNLSAQPLQVASSTRLTNPPTNESSGNYNANKIGRDEVAVDEATHPVVTDVVDLKGKRPEKTRIDSPTAEGSSSMQNIASSASMKMASRQSSNYNYSLTPNTPVYGFNYATSAALQQAVQHQDLSTTPSSWSPRTRSAMITLPQDVQDSIGYKDRRIIQTGPDQNAAETLDSRYRRVAKNSHSMFFVPGRVFKMLWTEPAGQANPGKTRNSTHFSTVWCGEQAYSEIRRFVIVRNKGTFSQCIPVQTYKGRGAAKPGVVMSDHGVIHTSPQAPGLLPGEHLTKFSIRVDPSGSEILEPASRVNYGKPYVVEHNVKVFDIGMVTEDHRYLIESYFDTALRGQ